MIITAILIVLSAIVLAGMVYGVMYAVIVPIAYLCGRSGYTRQNLNWLTVLIVGDPPFWRLPVRRRERSATAQSETKELLN